MYQMQISTDSDFKNIVYDSCAANGDGINGPDCNGSANSVPVYVMFTSASSSTPHINYGVPYYWRVKVWRTNNGKDSGWIYYDGIAGTPKMRDAVKYAYPYLHPSPTMSYNISADASPTTPAVFTDLSLCYNSDGTSHYCNDSTLGASNTYKWWFKYPSENLSDISSYQVSSAPTSISYTYVLPGTYPTKLQVCDGAEPDSDNPDGCCSARNSATVRTTNAQKVPQWWEISPF
jgi:hypothetical protein